MKIALESISPERAIEMLRVCGPQRKLQEHVVSRYARDMLAGQWVVSPQGIVIDVDGCLLDGQHRLNAIVRSQTTQRMYVARDATRDMMGVLDSGVTRSMSDSLTVSSVGQRQISKSDVAVIRAIVSMYVPYHRLKDMSYAVTRKLFERYWHVVESAAEIYASSGPLRNASVRASLAAARGSVDDAYWLAFVASLKSNLPDDTQGRNAPLLLNRYVQGLAGRVRDMDVKRRLFVVTSRALWLYVNGVDAQLLRTGNTIMYGLSDIVTVLTELGMYA